MSLWKRFFELQEEENEEKVEHLANVLEEHHGRSMVSDEHARKVREDFMKRCNFEMTDRHQGPRLQLERQSSTASAPPPPPSSYLPPVEPHYMTLPQ